MGWYSQHGHGSQYQHQQTSYGAQPSPNQGFDQERSRHIRQQNDMRREEQAAHRARENQIKSEIKEDSESAFSSIANNLSLFFENAGAKYTGDELLAQRARRYYTKYIIPGAISKLFFILLVAGLIVPFFPLLAPVFLMLMIGSYLTSNPAVVVLFNLWNVALGNVRSAARRVVFGKDQFYNSNLMSAFLFATFMVVGVFAVDNHISDLETMAGGVKTILESVKSHFVGAVSINDYVTAYFNLYSNFVVSITAGVGVSLLLFRIVDFIRPKRQILPTRPEPEQEAENMGKKEDDEF